MFELCDYSNPAVIPSALGPLQALIAILPYLLAVLGSVLVAAFKPATYRSLFRYCWAHKGLTALFLSPLALFFFRGALFGSKAAGENGGTAWTSYRGGPERTGAAPGAHGPVQNPQILWNEAKSSIGVVQAIDSSPTVVANRIYFGTSVQSILNKSGSITCLDTATGAVAWKFTGEGMDRPLQPTFCSPSIGGGAVGSADEARYLVTGEGYHVEQDSRIICLDLARTRASGGKGPEFKWAVTTTNHVECSPSIFEGKVYIGAGDDGWWCIDLESGKVKWRLEGNEYYVITTGPQADALAKLAGKTVAVDGSPMRFRPDKDKDFSIMLLDATGFTEVAPGTTMVTNPAQSTKGKDLRTVIGKVVVTDAVNNPEQKGSRVKIEMEKVYPDAECDPVALRIDGQPRLICGCGLDGKAVLCIDAETGREIWRTPTSDPVFCAPTVVNGKILVGLSNGTFAGSSSSPSGSVIALSAADGHVLWQYKTRDGVLGSVAVKDNRAYAVSLDGSLYVLDIRDGTPKDGKLLKQFDTGAPIFASPVVTDQAVFFSSSSGKVFCLQRESLAFQWSQSLTPNEKILSSPCVAGNRLFTGSATKGVFCISGEPGTAAAAVRKTVTVWSGTGGSAERANVADDRGAPTVNDTKADRIADVGKSAGAAWEGPMAACGDALYFSTRAADGKTMLSSMNTVKRSDAWQIELSGTLRAVAATEAVVATLADTNGGILLAFVDSKTGRHLTAEDRYYRGVEHPFISITEKQIIVSASKTEICGVALDTFKDDWRCDVGELAGAPACKHGLIFVAVNTPKPQLLCLDDSTRAKLWTADLATKPIGSPSVSGSNIFVALAGKSEGEAKIACRKLTDGGAIWEVDVEKAPWSPLALSGEHLAYTTVDGSVIVLETVKGEQTHTVPLGKGGQSPAIYQQTLFLAAENRVGAYDLDTSTWLWAYRDQKTISHAWAPPILANEVVWVSTEKQGLIGIGGKEK